MTTSVPYEVLTDNGPLVLEDSRQITIVRIDSVFFTRDYPDVYAYGMYPGYVEYNETESYQLDQFVNSVYRMPTTSPVEFKAAYLSGNKWYRIGLPMRRAPCSIMHQIERMMFPNYAVER